MVGCWDMFVCQGVLIGRGRRVVMGVVCWMLCDDDGGGGGGLIKK